VVHSRGCASLGQMWLDKTADVEKIGPIPLGGQPTKGPFFAGDAMYPAQLGPIAAKATTPVGTALDELQARTPLNIALTEGSLTWSFTDVKKHSDALARGFEELALKKGDVTVNGEDVGSMVATIAAEKMGLKIAVDKSVPANIVGTAAGTFPIADISVYNSTPVGKAGASIKKVTEAAPPQVQSYLKQVFASAM